MQQPVTFSIGHLLTTLSLAAVLGFGQGADAQTRAGSDGHALDANQQVGSNGVNPDTGRLDFSRRNDIITGNVGGGRAFQDTIDYTGVGEFQDNLGSDTLFNFRRSSLSSSPSFFNATGVGGVGQQGNVRVFRSFTNRSAQPQAPGLIAPQGGTYQVSTYTGFGTIYSGRVQTDAFRDSANRRTRGQALQAFQGVSAADAETDDALNNEALRQRMINRGQDPDQSRVMSDLSESLRVTGNMFDPFATTESDEQPQLLLAGQLPPSMLLGQQLQSLIDPQTGQFDPNRSQRVLDNVFERIEDKDTTSDDVSVYDRLLSDIQQGERAVTGSQGLADALDAPTSQQLSEAERAYEEIMIELYGEDYKSRNTESGDDADDQVRDVVGQLNYDLPRLTTLASDKQTRIADLTREAEAALEGGKYLTAETRYRQLLREVKDDPLPRAGLVHAQLGAGMFRSAGANLRALFVQHPELIATRYDAKLLPPKDRLQWVQQELQSVISQGEGGKDAPLLLAYLGYQADSRQLVRYGLALAQSKSPRDPMLLIVREIWLDESDTPSSSSDGE